MAQGRLGSREAYEASVRIHEEETGEVIDTPFEEVEKIMQSGGFEVEVPRTMHVEMMLATAPSIYEVVRRMTPHLLVSTGRGKFITGDMPIAFWDGDAKRRKQGLVGVGYMTPEVEVTLPLSSHCCLILNWDGQRKILQADEFGVANCNYFRASRTRQYLFGPQIDVPVLDQHNGVVWGEDNIIGIYADAKQQQPGIEIMGGDVPRRPPLRVQR